MAEYVVDAGVFVRWFVPQSGYVHAREVRDEFLAGQTALLAPDTVRYEVAHVLRTKGLLPGRLSREQYVVAARTLDDLDVDIRGSDADAIERGAALAADRGLRFFDAMLVELALRTGISVLTTDGRLARAVATLVPAVLLRDSQGSPNGQNS